MKKVILFASVVMAFSFASCKKDYVCTCSTTGSSTPDVTTYLKTNKKTARANCLSTTQAGVVTTCTLK